MRHRESIDALRRRLAEAEQALEAIRAGEVDSLVVESSSGMRVYALEGEDNIYRVLMETMNEGAATLNEDGLILYCNAHFASLLERPLEQVMGTRISAFLPEAQHRKLNMLLAAAREAPVRGELCLIGAGVEVPVQLSVNSLRQEEHPVLCLVATDLREQKRTEAIAASEKTLRKAAWRDSFCMALNDLLRPLVDPVEVQAQASRLLGKYLHASRVLYGEVSAGGTELIVERSYVTPGMPLLPRRFRMADFGAARVATLEAGRTIVLSDIASAAELSEDERTALAAVGVAALVDVPLTKGGRFVGRLTVHQSRARRWTADEVALVEETAERTWSAVQRARAEAALRQSEEKYRSLFNSIDQGFCIIEVLFEESGKVHDYRFIEVNPAFTAHTGLPDPTGKTISELVPQHDAHWLQLLGQIALTGVPAHVEHRAEALGRFYEVNAFRLGAPDERRVAVLFADIGDRKRAEEALREADKRKNEFLAVLSHELRNPLAPVLAAVQFMQRIPELDRRLTQPLDIIHRNVQLEARLIDDLLDLTRIVQGKLMLQRATVDVSTVIQRAVEVVKPDIENRRLHFGVDLCDEVLLVSGDASRLQQVIWNLLSNAVKFTPVGGRIALRCHRSDGHAVVEVNDSGIGIEADSLARVFDAFEQGSRGITRQFGGLGLGLAIAKRLVEMHEGTISAYSEGRNRGSTFRVSLPILSAKPGADTQRPAQCAVRESKRILLVEDNQDTSAMTKMLLEGIGYEVETARDVAQALKAIDQKEFDLLISDLGLPDRTGIDLMQELRRRGSSLKGIALSGYGREEDVRFSKEVGFSDHLTKPIDVDALLDTVSRIF